MIHRLKRNRNTQIAAGVILLLLLVALASFVLRKSIGHEPPVSGSSSIGTSVAEESADASGEESSESESADSPSLLPAQHVTQTAGASDDGPSSLAAVPDGLPKNGPTRVPTVTPRIFPTATPMPTEDAQSGEGTPDGTVPQEGTEPTEGGEQETPAPTRFCRISIDCYDIFDHQDQFEGDWNAVGDGLILGETEVELYEGDTVLSVLTDICAMNNIPLTARGNYIASIGGVSEFQAGATSGWTYYVNDTFANVGSDAYVLNDGDVISWRYSCAWNS